MLDIKTDDFRVTEREGPGFVLAVADGLPSVVETWRIDYMDQYRDYDCKVRTDKTRERLRYLSIRRDPLPAKASEES